MKFENKTAYAIDDWKKYEDDDDINFAYAHITFLSTRPNTHKHIYTLDVLKEYAPSYLGKFIVCDYDEIIGDATNHTNTQHIVGYIPPNQELKYTQTDDGFWDVSLDAVISKIYAPEIYDLFKEGNYRAVSVEQLVGFAEEDSDKRDGFESKKVIGFEGCGITILGLKYHGSVPSANMTMTKMCADNVKDIEAEYEKHKQNLVNSNITMSDIMDKLDNIETKLSKEDKMAELDTKTTEDSVSVEKMAELMNENKELKEQVEKYETTISEKDTEIAEYVEKVEKLESAKAELDQKIETYEAEISELKDFKASVQKAEMEAIISSTLAKAKEYMDDEAYAKYEASSKECKYEGINAWKNEVLANVSEKVLTKMSELASQEDGVADLGMPQDNNTEAKGLWD